MRKETVANILELKSQIEGIESFEFGATAYEKESVEPAQQLQMQNEDDTFENECDIEFSAMVEEIRATVPSPSERPIPAPTVSTAPTTPNSRKSQKALLQEQVANQKTDQTNRQHYQEKRLKCEKEKNEEIRKLRKEVKRVADIMEAEALETKRFRLELLKHSTEKNELKKILVEAKLAMLNS